jgi:uncharacterized protein (DUF952 family)
VKSSHTPTQTIVYKILPRAEWEAAVARGIYTGSADDLRDGFIHLSAASQLAGTARKFFKGQSDLLLVAFGCCDLGPDLRWEAPRGGQLFPHLYSPLPPDKALNILDLALGEDGVPVIPEGLL